MHKIENFCNLKMKIVFFSSVFLKNPHKGKKKSVVVSHFLKPKKKFFCKFVKTA